MVNIGEAKSIKKAYSIIVKKLDNAHYVVKDPETKENYFYYDHKINRDPITAGSIVKLIPNNQLYYVILAYDKLVEFVKTLPFGEEWMIRNTIIPPSEDDKKGEK